MEWTVRKSPWILPTAISKALMLDLTLVDPRILPFPDKCFDVVYVMYELQHIANDKSVQQVVDEATRVARQWVVLVEETSSKTYLKENVVRRPVKYYKEVF